MKTYIYFSARILPLDFYKCTCNLHGANIPVRRMPAVTAIVSAAFPVIAASNDVYHPK